MEIINLDFLFSEWEIIFFTSSFVKTSGIFFSLFGRFILTVISFPKMFKKEYFIADKNKIIDIAALSERFSERNNFTSSSVISDGCFFVKSRNFSLALT